MSEPEFELYLNGETLRNNTRHSDNARTTSVGFCFFPEEPAEAWRWLSGIVCDDVCCTFDVPDNKVRKSVATYSDPDKSDCSIDAMLTDILSFFAGDDMPNTVYMEKTEYCCKRYSKKDFKLIKYTYGKRYLERERLLEEWNRPQEELPAGMLLQGTLTPDNALRAFDRIHTVLQHTPLNGDMDLEIDDAFANRRFHITLPDGRVIPSYSRVEVYDDGTVLINGRLPAMGFPKLVIRVGPSGDDFFCLCTTAGKLIPIPQSLFKKYEAAYHV